MSKLISTRTAADMLKCSMQTARFLLGAPARQTSLRGVKFNYYSAEKVKKLCETRNTKHARNTRRTDTPHYKPKSRHCELCGNLTLNKNKICDVCELGYDKNDEYGVMLKHKKRTKKCPVCKTGTLWDYESVCLSCQYKMPFQEKALDCEQVYGSISL